MDCAPLGGRGPPRKNPGSPLDASVILHCGMTTRAVRLQARFTTETQRAQRENTPQRTQRTQRRIERDCALRARKDQLIEAGTSPSFFPVSSVSSVVNSFLVLDRQHHLADVGAAFEVGVGGGG